MNTGPWLLSQIRWVACVAALAGVSGVAAQQASQSGGAQVYRQTNVFSIHLVFTPEQWESMEPKGGDRGPFGGGGRGGGRGGFGPGMVLAPGFVSQGDVDKNGKLSKEEFTGLADRWFSTWDKDNTGQLTSQQVRLGISGSMPLLGGGPGGPGGMNLQGAEGKRNGLASAAGLEFNYVRASLTIDGQEFKEVAVRYKGNGTFMESRGQLKRSMKIDLNEYTKGQKFFGLTTLNLHNNVTDPSWMNEPLSYQLFRDAGVPAPRNAYAQVFVTVPGRYDRTYLGLYTLIENPDKNFAEEQIGEKKGAIFKPVARVLFDDLGDDWSQYQQTFDPKQTLTQEQKQRVIDLCKWVSRSSDEEFAQSIHKFLDLQEFASFMAVTVWLANMDSILALGQNFLVYLHPKSQQFQFWPWDLDHSFGQFPMVGTQEQREQLSIQKPWQGENRFLERVFRVEAFKKLYLERMSQLSTSVFKPERIHRQIDELAQVIRPSVEKESQEKLEVFNKVVAGEAVRRSRGGGPGPGGPEPGRGEGPGFNPGMFGDPPKPIRTFVTARAQSVSDQLAGKSPGLQIDRMGFGGRGRGGRPGGPGGPGEFIGRTFFDALDGDKNGSLSRTEFRTGFSKWFGAWDGDADGVLTEDQLRAGIYQDLSPFRGR